MVEGACARGRVLVVEDDASISDVVRSTLAGEGYACTCAYSGTEARLLIEGGEPFDLVVCDLMLPGMAGEEVVALIRAQAGAAGAVPILVTSAKAQVVDRVALLRMGADDYLVKPFDLDELVARADALLRRAGARAVSAPGGARSGDGAVCGDVRASGTAAKEAKASFTQGEAADAGLVGGASQGGLPGEAAARSADDGARSGFPGEPASLSFGCWRLFEGERRFETAGEPVRLTRTEFDILAALMRHPRKVFTKRELYRAVWNEDAAVEEKAINTHISNIRAKLRASGTDRYIETVWGIGFKLADNV